MGNGEVITTALGIGVFGMILGAAVAENLHDHTDPRLNSRPIYTMGDFPAIGTPEYTASCDLFYAHEDGSAMAICDEDGAFYYHDPDGDSTTGKAPGWYASGAACPVGQAYYGENHGCLALTG